MTPEISRRQLIAEGVALGVVSFVILEKFFLGGDMANNHNNRRQALAEKLSKDYNFEVLEVQNVLRNLPPGGSAKLINKKNEKYIIFKSKAPNKDGGYKITVGQEINNSNIS